MKSAIGMTLASIGFLASGAAQAGVTVDIVGTGTGVTANAAGTLNLTDLTETIGSPTPMEIPFIPRLQLPRGDLPYPIMPGKWHFRQSVNYSITANRAVLDFASRQLRCQPGGVDLLAQARSRCRRGMLGQIVVASADIAQLDDDRG